MRIAFIRHSLCCLLAAAVTVGCTASDGQTSSKTHLPPHFKAVTTCGMVTDIVRHVVGDKGQVVGLMGEGVDPHLYKPTTTDVVKVREADIIFYSGLMLEGRMADTFIKAARRGKPVYAVTELIDETSLLEPPDFEGHWDPHVWGDASAWGRCASAVAEALAEQDPPNAETYRANAKQYLQQIDAVHAYAKKVIASIPKEKRVLITAHDAFNYFGRAYGIEVKGIQGISTESEAGLADIESLVDMLVARKIPAVFVESSVSDKNVRALKEGAAAKGHHVVIGGTLFSDAMGAPGTYEGTYVGMIDHNATTIARALGGEAPERGMSGKLDPTKAHE